MEAIHQNPSETLDHNPPPPPQPSYDHTPLQPPLSDQTDQPQLQTLASTDNNGAYSSSDAVSKENLRFEISPEGARSNMGIRFNTTELRARERLNRERQEIMADWSNLPHDLVVSIAKRIHCLEDFIKFRSLVCKPWSSVVTKQHFAKPELPWIMLMTYSTKSTDTHLLIYNMTKDKIYKLHLPEVNHDLLCDSSLGWLITMNKCYDVKLLHPLRPASHVIELGRNTEFPASHVIELGRNTEFGKYNYKLRGSKFVLSSSPTCTSDYRQFRVMGYSNYPAGGICVFCENKWTFVKNILLLDIAHYQGHFYGVHVRGEIFVFDIEDPENVRKTVVAPTIPKEIEYGHPNYYTSGKYLVESGGSLLLVLKFSAKQTDVSTTAWFRVYKVPFGTGNWLDSEVKDLGTRSLFVSNKNSFSVEASNYFTCKANCIYFIESQYFSNRGIFNLKDGKVEIYDFPAQQRFNVWYQPSF